MRPPISFTCVLLAVACAAFSPGGARAGSFHMYGDPASRLFPGDAGVTVSGLWGAGGRGARLDLLRMDQSPSAFERSFVVRIARIFIDKVQVAQIAGLRIRLKIILE